MCFSAQADLVAGVVVGAIGVDALRHVRRPAERALAFLPVVLAGHQLVEVLVWMGERGEVSAAVGRTAVWLYLAIAFGVVPVLVPVAVAALEPEGTKKRWTHVFTAVGAAVAAVLMYAVVRGPVQARIEGRHVAYTVDLWHGGITVALYVLATTGALLLSSRRYVRRFGLANLVAAVLLAWANQDGLISLWCVWAAVMSTAVALHLRLERSDEPPAGTSRLGVAPPRAWRQGPPSSATVWRAMARISPSARSRRSRRGTRAARWGRTSW